MNNNYQNIAILGAGESGVGAALLAVAKGMSVFVSDKGEIKDSYKKELTDAAIEFEEGGHSVDRILSADLIVKSPGIPEKVQLIQDAINKGIPVVSEIEFAGYYTGKKMICITGSNGKTTTTMLTHHILKNAGLNVAMAGNVGESLARQVIEDEADYYVVELSSFQLDGMYDFKADVAVLLNITPDHLDRYNYEMQNYVNSKFRIIQNLTSEDWFVYNADDPIIMEEIAKRDIKAQMAPFSIEKSSGMVGYVNNNQININLSSEKEDEKPDFIMSIHDLSLKGKHNTQNSLASGITSKIIQIRNESIKESLSDFKNVEHRLEFVAKVNGIEFINDSKATNVNSTWYALECMEKPTVWIVGGVDKGNDYDTLIPLVQEKVTAIVCLGTDNEKIKEAFAGSVDVIAESGSAAEAVAMGYRLAKDKQTVLLSPACASFDLFENYEDRGAQFKAAVRAL
ncbi:UDP-N-acetylmuramoyl-L-alanine--D-glutamate ligase [Paracrocinitomix mangrovi]|uniref:UDP-N-acetylmuramoyl-L-alanine--D-glutamate ligase n=1 Tax=Paracrocinitomix mangrovi TaxID=2862509 RepID=UPI001C8D9D04|nr:UDP-N-acetylmuramoyl-L-alanine--D-glutamate ligase [Paracrocinitomix mangrovi]UKN03349.1 UDP-N-acetylmuramoyl-L-alanine--D-glutamate ligase [Paracrocinitomix mangrovi]